MTLKITLNSIDNKFDSPYEILALLRKELEIAPFLNFIQNYFL